MTDPYRRNHELTSAYDTLRSTAQVLQARYITLSRQAFGDPERQRTHKADLERVRDSVSRVDPEDREGIDTLTNSLRSELDRLRGRE